MKPYLLITLLIKTQINSSCTYHSSNPLLSAPLKTLTGSFPRGPYMIHCPSKDNHCCCWEFQADAHQSLMTALRCWITYSGSFSPPVLIERCCCLLWQKVKRGEERKRERCSVRYILQVERKKPTTLVSQIFPYLRLPKVEVVKCQTDCKPGSDRVQPGGPLAHLFSCHLVGRVKVKG